MRSVGSALAAALLAAGCGGRPPAVYVGESQHFRLYVDPELLPLPAAFAGNNALAALETQWSDVATMLKMPDGKIMYYWYALDHVSDACGDTHEGGCTKEEEMEIDAPLLPDAHELNHAYTYLRAPRRPIPFLAEGIAEAIGCEGESPIPTDMNADWRRAVAGVQSLDVYGVGGLFVRKMIRRYGIDEFMRYYEQSPERRDPALFAANFESFWGVPLDDVWAAFNTVELGVSFMDHKICPCSLPALAPSERVVDDPARAPYWTLPDLGGDTIALTSPHGGYQRVNVRDCAGIRYQLSGTSVLARLGSGAGWYVMSPIGSVAIDRFVADTCVEAAHYQLSPDILTGGGYLSVTVPVVGSESTIYLAIDVPFDAQVQGATGGVCDTCGFDQERCQAVPPGATAVSGTFYTRLQFYNGPANHEVNTLSLRFWP